MLGSEVLEGLQYVRECDEGQKESKEVVRMVGIWANWHQTEGGHARMTIHLRTLRIDMKQLA